MSFYRVALTTTTDRFPLHGTAQDLEGAEANARNIGGGLAHNNVVTFFTDEGAQYISAIHVVRWWVEEVPYGEVSGGDVARAALEDEAGVRFDPTPN